MNSLRNRLELLSLYDVGDVLKKEWVNPLLAAIHTQNESNWFGCDKTMTTRSFLIAPLARIFGG